MSSVPEQTVEKIDELLQRDIDIVWGELLRAPAGRLILWSILEKCHLFETTYTGNAASNFLEGERSVGLKILQERVFPLGMDIYTSMLLEAEAREKRLMDAIKAEDERQMKENEGIE